LGSAPATIVVMGVTGADKTTVMPALADRPDSADRR
jgi:signal recognition particle receptor subunit beta